LQLFEESDTKISNFFVIGVWIIAAFIYFGANQLIILRVSEFVFGEQRINMLFDCRENEFGDIVHYFV